LQYPSTGSHISSGLGTATVKYETISNQYVKVTCTTSTLTHYMVVKSGDSTIYMATHTTAEPTIGELRFIARLSNKVLPNQYPFDLVSTTGGSSSTVEGSDVFVVNGQTRSKFYSSERFIDDTTVRQVFFTTFDQQYLRVIALCQQRRSPCLYAHELVLLRGFIGRTLLPRHQHQQQWRL
jgi:hypothetical protein